MRWKYRRTKAWVRRLQEEMWATVQRVRRGGYLKGMKRGRKAYHLRWFNYCGKRCQVVGDVNQQLGSEEWLIRRHL